MTCSTALLGLLLLHAAPTADDRAALRAVIGASFEQSGSPAKPVPAHVSEMVKDWLRLNSPGRGLVHSTLGEQPWGLSGMPQAQEPGGASVVLLYVFDWHVSGKLVVYGLTGGVRKAYLLADADRSPLPATRVGSSTVFTVPKDPPDPLATTVVLELAGDKPETTEIIARPAKGDGRILMHARDAVVHGLTLRYEPEPHKDTVGYWTKPDDWVSWDFDVTQPGKYAVEILQGCGKGNGGSTVHFAVGEQVLPVTVQDTGGFQNFVPRTVGEFTFAKPGRYTLSVKPVKKAGKAIMDLRSVTLTPIK